MACPTACIFTKKVRAAVVIAVESYDLAVAVGYMNEVMSVYVHCCMPS